MYSTDAMYQYLIAQPSRLLSTRGLITYPDAATQALTAGKAGKNLLPLLAILTVIPSSAVDVLSDGYKITNAQITSFIGASVTAFFQSLVPGQSYRFSRKSVTLISGTISDSGVFGRVSFRKAGGASTITVFFNTELLSEIVTPPADIKDYIEILVYGTSTGVIEVKETQLELGSTATAYEPYIDNSAAIVSFQIEENAGDGLPLGGAAASTINLKLDNKSGEWNPGGSILGVHSLDGAIVSLEMAVGHHNYGVYPDTIDGSNPSVVYTNDANGGIPSTVYIDTIDGGGPQTFPAQWYWANVGTYVIETAKGQEQEALLDVKGADYLANRASKIYADTLTYPQTVAQILSHACAQAGITIKSLTFINSTVSIPTKPLWAENTTCRDVIAMVACLAAGFARIDRDGLLEIVALEATSDYALSTARYMELERVTTFGPFNSLSVDPYGTQLTTRVAVDLNIVDNEQNSIAVQGNPILANGSTALNTLIANMQAALAGLAFDSARIKWQGDQAVMTGDLVTLTDKSSNTVKLLVFKQSLSYATGFGMVSENGIKTVTKGAAKYLKVFTPSGKLNAAALEGDITIKAGDNLNLLAGADLNISAGGLLNLSATNQIVFSGGSTLGDLLGASGNVTYTGPTAPATPNSGDLWFDTSDYNICKRWSGAAWVAFPAGKLTNSKMTLDGTGIALLSAGTFTTASTNFMIDALGNVSMKGSVTADTGYIGGASGFTIASLKLYSGKSTLTGTDAGVYVGTDGISLGSAGVAPQFKVTAAGAITASSGVIGDFTLSNGHLVHSNSGNDYFMDISGWGMAVGADASSPNYHFPFKVLSHYDSTFGHMVCTYGRLGALDFAPDAVIVKTSNTVYSGTRVNRIILNPTTAAVTAYGGFFTTTPGYAGTNALEELRLVKNDSKGDIDHATLPISARGKIKVPSVKEKDTKGIETEIEPEREDDTCDLGMMINILTKAVQELDARLDKLEVA